MRREAVNRIYCSLAVAFPAGNYRQRPEQTLSMFTTCCITLDHYVACFLNFIGYSSSLVTAIFKPSPLIHTRSIIIQTDQVH
jgi:hypothetical protein